jgi:hypothetical protein
LGSIPQDLLVIITKCYGPVKKLEKVRKIFIDTNCPRSC